MFGVDDFGFLSSQGFTFVYLLVLLHDPLPNGGIYGQTRCASRADVNKPTVVRDAAMAEQPCQHCQSLIGERLVDEWLLALKRLDCATGRKSVLLVELRIDNLRKQVRDRGQARRAVPGISVVRLPQNKLAAIGIVADIEPVPAIPIGTRGHDRAAGFAGVHTPDEDVRLSSPTLVEVAWRSLPAESPK